MENHSKLKKVPRDLVKGKYHQTYQINEKMWITLIEWLSFCYTSINMEDLEMCVKPSHHGHEFFL